MIIKKQSPVDTIKFILGMALIIFGISLLFAFLNWGWLLINVFGANVEISPSGHFFAEPVTVELRSPVGGEIRYTLDGSDPNDRSTLYETPLTFVDPTLLNVAVFRGDDQISPTVHHDFFVATNHELPVISIDTDPKNLFDEELGIYVKGNNNNNLQEGKKWERDAVMRFFGQDNSLHFESNIGLRLHGRDMREAPQKSFRIYIQDKDGQESTITYPLFQPDKTRQFSSLVLRNGGGDNRYTMLRDSLASELVSQASTLNTLQSRPIVLYLNGQYWGLYFLQERYDDQYFSQRYKVSSDAISVVETPLDNGDDRGLVVAEEKSDQTDADLYNRYLIDARRCVTCLSIDSAKQIFDLRNMVDYFIYKLYFANFDWPYNNHKAWRYKEILPNEPEISEVEALDGRFRMLFFDIDVGFGFGRASAQEMIEATNGDPYAQLIDNAFPFRNLFYNPSFRQVYLDRAKELTQDNLSSENISATLDRMADEVRSEMPNHINRWKDYTFRDEQSIVSSMEEWEFQLEMIKVFAERRPEVFIKLTEDFFERTKDIK